MANDAPKKQCALCDEPARVGAVCDACHDSMGTKPAGDCGPINPYSDWRARYWQDGFDGKEIDAAFRGSALAAWNDGRSAAPPTPSFAVKLGEESIRSFAATPAAPGEAAVPSIRDALAELVDLMQGVIDGNYEPDSFTLQPARAALSNPAPVAAPASPSANPKFPPPELTWLYTHCRAIGMTCKSDSGKWEHDIALFTINLQEEIKTLQRAALAAPAPASEAVALRKGWKLVPIKPTEEMLRAGLDADAYGRENIHSWDDPQAVYRAMLAATPTPGDSADAPVQQAGEECVQRDLLTTTLHVLAAGSFSGSWKEDADALANDIRAALKGEQPVEPSGTERGEV